MFDFHEKRKIRSILYSKTVFVLLVLLVIFLSSALYNRYTVAENTKAKLDARQDDLEALEVRATILEEKVEYLDNERGIEEELRNRFDVAKEDEQVVIILEDKTKLKSLVNSDEENQIDGESSFWEVFKFW